VACHVAARLVCQRFGKQDGIGLRGVLSEPREELLGQLDAAEGRAEHDGNAIGIERRVVDAGILEGEGRSDERPHRQAIQPTRAKPRHHVSGAKRRDENRPAWPWSGPPGNEFRIRPQPGVWQARRRPAGAD
jgi:hypothetical protein